MTLDHSTSVISQPFTTLTSWLRLNLIFYKVIIIIAAVSKRKGEDGASFVPRSDGSWGLESTSAPGDRFIFSRSKLCARTWGSTWIRLEWRSMSGDTSGACCQGKLSYLATSRPLPPLVHTNTRTRAQSDSRPFLFRPQGSGEDRREGVVTKLLTERWISATAWCILASL